MLPMPLLAAADVSLWPFVVLVVSVAFVILAISKLRLHAFLALTAAALLAGVLAERLPGGKPRTGTYEAQPGEKLVNHYARAVELTTKGFGDTAGGIAISIGLASIIGMCLMESGAADKVVRRFLAVFGERNAGLALMLSTYVLSVPIFFDTMFMLMVPIAKALRLRTGKDYLLYVLCICIGGVVTHSMTVPHPGPLAAVENLKLDVGFSIMAGFLVGLPAALGGWLLAKWLNRRAEIPLREVPGSSLDDLHQIVNKPESQLPGFVASLVPVVLPIFLISLASFFVVVQGSATEGRAWAQGIISTLGGASGFASVNSFVEFIGNKNIALILGAVVALIQLAKQKGYGFADLEALVGPPLATAGTIILITSAGGAFGLMLRSAGMADAIKGLAEGRAVNLLVLAYVVGAVLRVAQGSATVSMLTTSAMMYPMIDPAQGASLPYHPMYVYLAVGFASFGMSWMNDSGFWVVSRLGGLTEKETLKSWTVSLTVVSLLGFVTTLILATVLPFK